jgi:trehalose-phosphatase
MAETSSHLLLLLDFDGTLAVIAESPGLVRLPATTRAILEGLSRRADCTVGIVSGRSLADVRERIGIDGLIYAGNHGLEIDGRGLRFDEATAIDHKGDIARAVDVLAARLGHIDGVMVEPKGLTASIHYRTARPADRDEVERVVRTTILREHPDLVVTPGKMVWEVRPRVGWNKGTAVRWIRERLGLGRALTFYIGDDRTDEDAFEGVGPFVTARVGPPQPTRAGYIVADPGEVAEFLLWLARVVDFSGPPEATGMPTRP